MLHTPVVRLKQFYRYKRWHVKHCLPTFTTRPGRNCHFHDLCFRVIDCEMSRPDRRKNQLLSIARAVIENGSIISTVADICWYTLSRERVKT